VLVNEYRGGRMPVFHFDTYRLKDEDEFLALGPEEYFEGDGLTFVEWGDRVAELLPKERIEITIRVIEETKREFTVRGTTPRMEEIVMGVAKVVGGVSDADHA
jgi:tRNA threonylcarbamoyladenosine biosynthesis protein TsaE